MVVAASQRNIKKNINIEVSDSIAVFNENHMVLATRYFPANALVAS